MNEGKPDSESEPREWNTYARMRALKAERIGALKKRLESMLPRVRQEYKGLDLEIGCGHGHWMIGYGEANPDRFCIGIDLMSRRVRMGNNKREKRNLTNLEFLKAEAREFLESLPLEVTLDRVYLHFPDPWPKARHHKKRLVREEFLTQLKPYMASGGRLYFRTDHEEYFEWAREAVAGHPDWRMIQEEAWPFEASSYFQDLVDSWQSFIAGPIGSAD